MVEFVIERLGHQGDGIASGPVFAPLTLPGEKVTGRLEGQRLAEIRIESASDRRVKPPCRHFKTCGGCQVQHADDDFVADWKTGIVRQALTAQGMETDFRPILTSPTNSRRRATLSARRTKKGAMVGFHARASDMIVEIPDCQLLDSNLLAALPIVEKLASAAASRKGELSVTVTLSDAGLDMAVTGGKPLDAALRQMLAADVERLKLARLSWDGEVIAMRAPPYQKFGNAKVTPPPGAFLQATSDGEASLLKAVREVVGDSTRIVDLFAGCGTFSLPLAENAIVHAVEGAPEMIHALDQGWRMSTGLKHLSAEARDLFRRPLLPDELRQFDAAVIDPPRAGAEAQIAQLTKAKIPDIAYASCNPVTFARDAKTLVDAGYNLDWIQVVDQFRWSAHVELVAKLRLTTA